MQRIIVAGTQVESKCLRTGDSNHNEAAIADAREKDLEMIRKSHLCSSRRIGYQCLCSLEPVPCQYAGSTLSRQSNPRHYHSRLGTCQGWSHLCPGCCQARAHLENCRWQHQGCQQSLRDELHTIRPCRDGSNSRASRRRFPWR